MRRYKTRKEYIKDGAYLPSFLRDFHDQKDLFKTIDHFVQNAKRDKRRYDLLDYNWVTAHIYTIDFFLWFMAQHGYTLQRSRYPVSDGFCDLPAGIKAGMERWYAAGDEAIKKAHEEAHR